MTKSLDEIMEREPVIETNEGNEPAEQPNDAPERDEKGQFAAKAGEPEPVAAEGEPEPTPEAQPEGEQGGTVPQQALHEARRREKEAKERADDFQRQLQQMQGQMQLLMQQRQPQQDQQQKKAPDFWENPNEFVNHALTPVQQQLQAQREGFSRMMAEDKYGAEAVQEAYQSLGQAMQTDPAAQADYQRIMQSQHPYAELVTWHQRRQLLNEVGTDPSAYREKLRQEIMAELQQQPAPTTPQQPAARQPMPNSFATARNQGPRTGVAYTGPKPLSEITKGAAQ